MRKFRHTISILLVAFLGTTFFLSAQAQNGVDAKLFRQCDQGDGKSCAFIGALIFKRDEKLARKYYGKACDKGHTASCVFRDGGSVGNVKLPASESKPASDSADRETSSVSAETAKAEALRWYDRYFRHYMESWPPSRENGERRMRSKAYKCINGSRQEGTKFISTWVFGEHCDVNGTSTILEKTDTMMSGQTEFKTRYIDDVTQFVFNSHMQIDSGTGKTVSHAMRNGLLINALHKVVLKYYSDFFTRQIRENFRMVQL